MPPFAPVLMQSTRAIGYSLEAAIADIIDNSIAAKAGKVQLSFFPVGDAYVSNFASAKRRFAEHGYRLPQIVFWNVASRNSNQPVTKNEQGVALVSGCTPRLFSMVASGDLSPYSVMMDIIESERYAKISA